MESSIIKIPNISCKHCVMAIKNELSEIEGIKKVEGNPESKTISVDYDSPATIKIIKEKLAEINYPAED